MSKSIKNISSELVETSSIHNHTDIGSPGDGAGKITDYMEACKERGVTFMNLSDHGDLSGILQFYRACKKAGIVPGIGCEFYLNDNRDLEVKKKKKDDETISIEGEIKKSKKEEIKEKRAEKDEEDNPDDLRNNHLICSAKTERGIKSLIKINNEAVMNGFKGKPRTTTEKVFELAEDMLISTACLAGFASRHILNDEPEKAKRKLEIWKERFKDDFYIELQINELKEQRTVNEQLLKFAHELKIKPILAGDCHYVSEGDDFLQLIKMLNRTRRSLKDLEDGGVPKGMWVFHAKELYLKTNEQILSAAKRLNYDIDQNTLIDCLINNHEWRHKTKVHWDLSRKHYNKFVPPAGFKTSKDYFVHLVSDGLRTFLERGYIPMDRAKEYSDRAKFEMKMLIEKDFCDYLLETKQSMDDVVAHLGGSRLHLGVGRGSVGACLCAYLLGITKIDPIKHDLLFFRFLSDSRSNEMLDIDV